VRELVEDAGGIFEDAADRYEKIPRPADQLRGSIEAMRREIRNSSAALSESAGKLAGLGLADLPPQPQKDSTAPSHHSPRMHTSPAWVSAVLASTRLRG